MIARTAIADAAIGALLLVAALVLGAPSTGAAAAPRVMSLDQCADQYVLALSPRSAVVGLSPRVLNADSWLRARAVGLPVARADSESALALRPQLVIRYWGGDPKLVATLVRRGATVVTLEDAVDFSGVRRNVRRTASALGQSEAGERLIAGMDAQLAHSADAWRGRGALYLTSGGATSGPGTLIDSILRAAGLRNLTGQAGFRALSLERLTLDPPAAVVEGFFDPGSQAQVRWGPARHGALRRITRGKTLVSLPGALLGCPAWFVGDAVARIARVAPAAPRCVGPAIGSRSCA